MNKRYDSFQGRPIVSEDAGVTVTRVGAYLGAEITGVDLRKPISDEAVQRDRGRAGRERADRLPQPGDQLREPDGFRPPVRRTDRASVRAERQRRSVLIKFRNDETNPPFGTDVWHSDETFRKEPPMATMLVAKEVPAVGGDTMFASMAAAFDGLSDRMQNFVSGLEAIHDFKPFRALFDEPRRTARTCSAARCCIRRRSPGGARASGVGPQGAVRQSAVHSRDQGYG